MGFFIIIRGPLGCGKTTIAKKLSEKIKANYISIDEILDKNRLSDDREDGYISQKSFKKSNQISISMAKKFLNKGNPVIFDGNFYWKSQIEDLENNLNYPHYVFTLKASLDTCVKRDELRKTSHGKDATRVVYNKVNEFDYGIVIDVKKTADKIVKEIISYLPR